ncbi:MAG: AAA family ATPase [Alphaproteobacteria bacterium]
MQFTKLRLAGFKSFVEPTEVPIEPGMTGVVGPNGCGKSNLVEALRWVMGETRVTQLRGGAMDDVIFSGTEQRPARNLAEVTLVLDNTDRLAPAVFNDSDELQVSRRIEREHGSTYRVNGKEVRARDVQLLFADAASGAHSTALVSQGRIGAIINARPTDRRSILEEAAGITGLHSRRHEAELRLRAAEQNLERLEDVMQALQGQLDALHRQARQARRYRRVGEQLRQLEAILLHLRHAAASAAVETARAALAEIEGTVGERTAAVAAATTRAAETGEGLPALREAEAAAAAAVQRLNQAQASLDEEERRLAEATAALEDRLRQTDTDKQRQVAAQADAATSIARLDDERQRIEADRAGEGEAIEAASAETETLAKAVAEIEEELERLAAAVAARGARGDGLRRRITDSEARLARLTGQRDRLNGEQATIEAEIGERDARLGEQRQVAEQRSQAAEAAQAELAQAEQTAEVATNAAARERDGLRALENKAAGLAAEIKALRNILHVDRSDLWPPMIDAVEVEAGFEVALGAALGEDLDAPADTAAPVHWAESGGGESDPALPAGARPLSELVRAPAALRRRLAQIGLVDAEQGPDLAKQLRPGQRLVSADGALWRWDGYTITAGAETPAAARLRQRNHLAQLERDNAGLEPELADTRQRFGETRAGEQTAHAGLKAAREAARAAEQAQREATSALERAERDALSRSSRLQAVNQSLRQVAEEIEETERAALAAKDEQAALAAEPDPGAELPDKRQQVAERRSTLADARSKRDLLRRDAALRAERLAALAGERRDWQQRHEEAGRHLAELDQRLAKAGDELADLRQRPAKLAEQRNGLLEQLQVAEAARSEAADKLAIGETAAREAQNLLRAAEQALASVREERVRRQGVDEQARARLDETIQAIRTDLECQPREVLAKVEANPEKLPELDAAVGQIERLKREQDRIGPVNLRAELEAEELQLQLDTMTRERDDLTAAIARLRTGISSLNREGRERLLAAFEQVNAHFTDLFTRLFGGGKAHLSLTGDDDPLEAGLEIMASPPGKKLQKISLLSGGEQALTALSLLFGVFMVKPAPVCVLDEVDAPLDDANVERFCNLVAEIANATGTRFLVVTHHAFSMARMDRLFGVTMAERGVSQLVSVDLVRAERLVASA